MGYRHTIAKSLILCSLNSNPNPKYIFGIWMKWLIFVEIMFDCGKHKPMTHITKMGADRLAKNTPKFIYTNCLAKPKILAFQ